MQITIRLMTEQDWPVVGDIYRQGIDSGLATFQTEVPTYREWDSSHIAVCRFVALADGEIAGWVALSKISERPVYSGVAEVSIYIAQAFRGQGVGRTLLNQLAVESEKAGFWMLQSNIFEDNAASRALHEKCGYRTVGHRERIGQDGRGRWRTNIEMERRSAVVGID